MKYNGLPVNEGIIIGRIRKISSAPGIPERQPRAGADDERMRFFDALLEFESSMKAVASSASTDEGRDIISGQIMIARDPLLSDEVLSLIDSGMTADAALSSACRKYEAMLDSLEDDLISERLEDLLEVKNGILTLMGGKPEEADGGNSDGDVVFAERLSAAELVRLGESGVKAVLMQGGTATSHAAVILRSLGIPAVFGISPNAGDLEEGTGVIVDGASGIVITDPSEEQIGEYSRKAVACSGKGQNVNDHTGKCVTLDGAEIKVLSNIGSEKIPEGAKYSDGAGLVRTEFLFLSEGRMPTEEEQEKVYRKIADSFPYRETVIRTLDIGGDKNLGDKGENENCDNPALGIRGVRLSLDNSEEFSHQISAILRASYNRKISIMVPMVTCANEVIRVKRIIEECRSALREKGIRYSDEVRLGCMIETPAAVFSAGELAHEVDFFSIGTNDLSQYIMCADRGNPHMAGLCSMYQPAVIRAVRMVCDKAAGADIPVTVCGEAAADEKLLPVFIGLGVRNLSVDASRISSVKNSISTLRLDECKKTALKVLNAGCDDEVRNILGC